MAISSIGASDLDPFTPTQGRDAETSAEPVQEIQTREPAPLPEGLGTQVDTTA